MSEEKNLGKIEMPNPEPKELPNIEGMVCGYVVGLDEEGNLMFEVLGANPGLIQLLGLHTYAEHRLMIAKDVNQGYGVPLLAKQLENVQKTLSTILTMLTNKAKADFGGLIVGK